MTKEELRKEFMEKEPKVDLPIEYVPALTCYCLHLEQKLIDQEPKQRELSEDDLLELESIGKEMANSRVRLLHPIPYVEYPKDVIVETKRMESTESKLWGLFFKLKDISLGKSNSMKERECIEFAEWLSKNEWIKREHTHPNKVGKYYSNLHCEYKSIEELYEIFKSNK